MSKPPAGFPPEQGYTGRCGASWSENIVVDGALPGDVRGRDVTHEITRITEQVGGLPTRELEYADALRDKIAARIAHIRILVAEASDTGVLAPTQSQSLEWLLKHADAHLNVVFEIHDAWLYRENGAFPLNVGDTSDDFTAPEENFACTKRIEGTQIPYGRVVKGGTNLFGELFLVTCPTRAELDARPVARRNIKENFEDALANVRCAEYWLWKARLVRQAGVGPDDALGLAPGAGTPTIPGFKPGTGSTVGLDFFAPVTPPGDVDPDPEGLPGGEEEEEDPEASEGGPLITEPSPAPPPSTSKALLLGGLAVLGFVAYTKLK